MAQATCMQPGCGKPHRARGLCSTHYKQQQGSGYRYHQRTCVVCERQWQTTRATAKYCSDTCKGVAYSGKTECAVPDLHPSRSARVPTTHPSRRPQRAPVPTFFAGYCAECGRGYIIASACVSASRYCSTTCAKRTGKRIRRAREHGASGSYTWDGFTRLAMSLGNCCAYCGAAGPLEPDHVVPLSRGGHNGLTNILPACRRCNGDKRNLLVHEWKLDRQSRRVSPRRYDVHRFVHLSAHPTLFDHAA